MGSTSIKGMMGKPLVDFAMFTKDLLPEISNDFITDMENQGY